MHKKRALCGARFFYAGFPSLPQAPPSQNHATLSQTNQNHIKNVDRNYLCRYL
jgi:hypothetical protein